MSKKSDIKSDLELFKYKAYYVADVITESMLEDIVQLREQIRKAVYDSLIEEEDLDSLEAIIEAKRETGH